MILDFLNKRNSLRALSDEKFEDILPTLASELSELDFLATHSDEDLFRDWEQLKNWNSLGKSLNSTSRIGMKLCEHFFPNFYKIENKNGDSFISLWKTPKLMEQVLRWNRKSHSTPYLSELKRGVYFCGGLAKSTMYRPQMAKLITKESSVVFDPCMGWGGRLLGTVSNGSNYIGFEPNTETYNGLQKLVDFLGIKSFVTLIHDDVLNLEKYELPHVDCILTSPPYFDLEIYSHEQTQSTRNTNSYVEWETYFLNPVLNKCLLLLKSNGKSCWNVAKVGKNDMWSSIKSIHEQNDFFETDVFEVVSSKRQVNQTNTTNKKSSDKTVVYSKTKKIKETCSNDKFLQW